MSRRLCVGGRSDGLVNRRVEAGSGMSEISIMILYCPRRPATRKRSKENLDDVAGRSGANCKERRRFHQSLERLRQCKTFSWFREAPWPAGTNSHVTLCQIRHLCCVLPAGFCGTDRHSGALCSVAHRARADAA